MYLKYVDWRRRIPPVRRGSGEVASRGMKELLSGRKLYLFFRAYAYVYTCAHARAHTSGARNRQENERELFSARRGVNNADALRTFAPSFIPLFAQFLRSLPIHDPRLSSIRSDADATGRHPLASLAGQFEPPRAPRYRLSESKSTRANGISARLGRAGNPCSS